MTLPAPAVAGNQGAIAMFNALRQVASDTQAGVYPSQTSQNVPIHSHKQVARPIPSILYTRNDGASPHLTFGQDYIIVLNDNCTPQLDDADTQNPGGGQTQLANSNGNRFYRDEWGTTQYLPQNREIQQTMTILLIQDDVGGHTFTLYNNISGAASQPFTSNGTNGAFPAITTTANKGTLLELVWMGSIVGWVIRNVVTNITPRFTIMPSSVTAGAPTYLRSYYQWTVNTTPSAAANEIYSAVGTYAPAALRQALYNKGFILELNEGSYSHALQQNVGPLNGLSNGSGPCMAEVNWNGTNFPATATAARRVIPIHEMCHEMDYRLWQSGQTITYPDNATYWVQQANGGINGIYSTTTTVSNKSGISATIYRISDHWQIQQWYLTCEAAYRAGGTSLEAYFMYGPTNTGPAGPAGLIEWWAQMMGGYYYSKVAADDSQMLRAGTAAVVASFKTWAAANLSAYGA